MKERETEEREDRDRGERETRERKRDRQVEGVKRHKHSREKQLNPIIKINYFSKPEIGRASCRERVSSPV